MLACLFVLGPQQTDDLSLLLAPWQLGLAPALNMQKKMIAGVFATLIQYRTLNPFPMYLHVLNIYTEVFSNDL